MRIVLPIVIVGGVLWMLGCAREAANSNTVDEVAPAGVTQPSPPEPGAVAGPRPRDPANRPPRINADPSGTPEPTIPRPAPENSEFSVMMNADGSITEFRNFRAHPRIRKVEANWFAPSEKKLKIYLTNGKVVETTTDRVPELLTVETSVLVELIDSKQRKGK